jgi:hypothetical protein
MLEMYPQWFKIIGRPIRLADVLLAIGKVGLKAHINQDGYFPTKSGNTTTLNYWNLRTDDLTQQSDECIDFLYMILN